MVAPKAGAKPYSLGPGTDGKRFPPNAFAPKLLSGGQAAAATPFAGLKQMKCSAQASAQFGGFGAKPVFDGGSGADVTVTLRKGSESEPHGLTFADREAPLHIMAIVDRSPATKGFGAKPQIGQVLVSLQDQSVGKFMAKKQDTMVMGEAAREGADREERPAAGADLQCWFEVDASNSAQAARFIPRRDRCRVPGT